MKLSNKLNAKADSFLGYITKSKHSFLWLAGVFMAGYFSCYYIGVNYHEDMRAELAIPDVQQFCE